MTPGTALEVSWSPDRDLSMTVLRDCYNCPEWKRDLSEANHYWVITTVALDRLDKRRTIDGT